MPRPDVLRSQQLRDYFLAAGDHDTDLEKRLRAETAQMSWGHMQLAADQGGFLALLVRLGQARRAIELGTFTGYSALKIAGALPEDGALICCDTSREWTAIAQRYWREAGLDHKIELRLGPALQTLGALIDKGESGRFDLVFIDADKGGYPAYYEAALDLLRPGGLIICDNAAPIGIDAPDGPPETAMGAGMHDFVQMVSRDQRVDSVLIPIGAGFLLALKREGQNRR